MFTEDVLSKRASSKVSGIGLPMIPSGLATSVGVTRVYGTVVWKFTPATSLALISILYGSLYG